MTHREKITLVLFFLSVCATAVVVHSYDLARMWQAGPAELFGAVQGQIDACRDHDFSAAYRQASATVQSRWPQERFEAMVRNEYSRALKAGRIEFGAWRQDGGNAAMAVYFIDRSGTVTPCLYSLVREGTGWKVDGTRWGKSWRGGLRGVRI